MTRKLVNTLCVIGVGLIGGSLARAARHHGLVDSIIGCGRDEAHLRKAVELGVIDRYTTDIAEAVKEADLVVVAVPVNSIEAVFTAMRNALANNTVITDVGSVKGSVIKASQSLGKYQSNFVPGHPIAGTENSGVEASFAGLFDDRVVLLTPTEQTSAQALNLVEQFWSAISAEVIQLDAVHHDEVLAATSHLPHVLAFALVDNLARTDSSQEIFRYAAGGFRDFTRIASSNPQMWSDICLANDKALLNVLEAYMQDLGKLREAIAQKDSESILKIFENAKRARDAFVIK